MECENCGAQLPKNSSKNGIDYFYCRKCKKSYSSKKHELKHHVFEEYIARLMFEKCVKQKNQFTGTVWTKNQIARLLGHHHRDISKWVSKKVPATVDKKELIKYIRARENGIDILCVLGMPTANDPSENLNKIVNRKPRPKREQTQKINALGESDYLKLINMPIVNRMDAIVVLSALLGCKSSEIFGANYNEISKDEKTILFCYNISFRTEFTISKWGKFASGRSYPLTERMLDIINWLKADTVKNMQTYGEKYNESHKDFICVDENGDFIKPYLFKRHIDYICSNLGIPFSFEYYKNDTLKTSKLMVWFNFIRRTIEKVNINAY